MINKFFKGACIKNFNKNVIGSISVEIIHLKDDFIKLGQALKAAGLAGSGVDAKFYIHDGLVKVNGQVEKRRGKKLVAGDLIEFDGNTVKIEV